MINDKMLVQMQKLNRAIIIGFVILGFTLLFWSVLRAQAILAREDNPRLVEAALRIQRGQILDRHDTILAFTNGPADALQRSYPISTIGPAVGYYSFRHGTAGVEESFDALLRGDTNAFWAEFQRQSLHRIQQGRDIRLTLDARLQRIAAVLSQDHTGAVILLSLPQAEILVLASFPGYDPNQLDENFDALMKDESAPLLNRVTQGQYQPGLVLQPLILAAALDQGLLRLDDPALDVNRTVQVNGVKTGCSATPPPRATWADVLTNRCPGPMAALSGQLGLDQLEQILAGFGLTSAPSLPLDTEMGDLEPLSDTQLAGIGQDNLVVTPLQIGLAWSTLGLDGRIPAPRLVAALQDEAGQWLDNSSRPAEMHSVVSPAVANGIRQRLSLREGMAEFATLVLSGPAGSTHAWYLGLAPATSPDFAVVVVLEDTATVADATIIGRALLSTALP